MICTALMCFSGTDVTEFLGLVDEALSPQETQWPQLWSLNSSQWNRCH